MNEPPNSARSREDGALAGWRRGVGSLLDRVDGASVRVLLACVFALAALVYAQTVGFDFVWDDVAVIRHNPNIHSVGAALRTFIVKSALPETVTGFDESQQITQTNYRPLRNLVHALVWQGWGDTPAVFHLLNVLCHGVVSSLLFLVLLRLCGNRKLPALAGAAIFAVHPLTTEAVCWAKLLEELIAASFLLGAYVVWLDIPDDRTPWRKVAAPVFFVFALFAKISVAFFPVFLLLHVMLVKPQAATEPKVREEAGGVADPQWRSAFVMAVLVLGFVLLRHAVLGKTAQCDFITGDRWTTWLSMPRVFLRYMRLIVVPVGLLADYHVFPRVAGLTDSAGIGFSLLFLTSVVAGTWLCWKHDLLTGWLWFLAALLPVSNLVPMMQLGAERFVYIPLMGAVILLTQGISRVRDRQSVGALALAAVLLLAAGTVGRSRVWRDDLALWQRTAVQTPGSPRALKNLAKAYLGRQMPGPALPVLNELWRHEQSAENALLLGLTRCLTGDLDQGIAMLRTAGAHQLMANLGTVAANEGDLSTARRFLSAAAELAPDRVDYGEMLRRVDGPRAN